MENTLSHLSLEQKRWQPHPPFERQDVRLAPSGQALVRDGREASLFPTQSGAYHRMNVGSGSVNRVDPVAGFLKHSENRPVRKVGRELSVYMESLWEDLLSKKKMTLLVPLSLVQSK